VNLVRIADAADPALADYVALTDVVLRRRTEPEHGLYIAEGSKVIARALAAGHRPRSVLLQGKWLDEISGMVGDEVPIYLGEPELLRTVTGYEVHRGALASMQRPVLPDPATLLTDARLVVVVEDVVDHTNVGAIFRAAAGLGADAVLVSQRCADPLYRRSVKVSMGTVFQVPWTRLPEWPEAVDLLHSAGFHLAALALAEDAIPLDSFAASGHERIALVLGAEGDGLSRAAISAADTVVTIPMLHGVDSLNVASAGAVALWALRHEHSPR